MKGLRMNVLKPFIFLCAISTNLVFGMSQHELLNYIIQEYGDKISEFTVDERSETVTFKLKNGEFHKASTNQENKSFTFSSIPSIEEIIQDVIAINPVDSKNVPSILKPYTIIDHAEKEIDIDLENFPSKSPLQSEETNQERLLKYIYAINKLQDNTNYIGWPIKLNLCNCQLSFIPDEIGLLKSVNDLEISWNKFDTYLPESIYELNLYRIGLAEHEFWVDSHDKQN